MRYYRPMMMSPTPSTSALVVLRRYHVVCRPIFEWRSGYPSAQDTSPLISVFGISTFRTLRLGPRPKSTSL